MDSGLFVSSVEGHLVSRLGTSVLIGAQIDLSVEGHVRFDTEKIVHIPPSEYAMHRREYDAAVTAGALRVRSREEYDAARAEVK